jgi:hypothetical protein
MGQTASQIENDIDNKRKNLGSNLQELESRIKSATAWRHQFRNRPLALLGMAFGGGVLLASQPYTKALVIRSAPTAHTWLSSIAADLQNSFWPMSCYREVCRIYR